LIGGGLIVGLFAKDSRIGGTTTGMAIPAYIKLSRSSGASLRITRQANQVQAISACYLPTAPIMQLHMMMGSWWSIVLNHDAMDIFG